MKGLFSNTKLIITTSFLFALLSLTLSICSSDVAWFQASGAMVTIGGVLLAARKMIRKGLEKYIHDEQNIDYGHFIPTPEEIEDQRQFENDINSYRWSIVLLITGTFIWAYGGIVLMFCCVEA